MEFAIVFLPLLAALFVGLQSRSISHQTAQFITSSATGISAALSIILFVQHVVIAGGGSYVLPVLRWFDVGGLDVSWSIMIDSLTAVMLVVVTVVSTLVHVYSVGYMSHDPHVPRFMSYLSLFTFFMLVLVTSDNFVQLFVGWEGVGLCSYLLIGFWYKKASANAAAMKAFIVNRVGDFGMALGLFAIFMVFGTLEFKEVFALAPNFQGHSVVFWGMEFHTLTLICFLLFIGAMGKSAQLGLHTWLPDAMEGPTPVSALIHAATMVTAGVFLVARCSYLFEYAPDVLDIVTIVGASTCIFAASIALVQNDIKKIIAYSTCSQLGYMFFACGVSAYSAGIFHLMTHAFFKALLFLGAGSVIHALSDEQDIRKMGGTAKHLIWTCVLMYLGSLAIAGIPPFAGYFSKDIVLESAYASGTDVGRFAYWVGVLAALFTAFYSWRLLVLTFHGAPRASKKVMSHIHESPPVMLLPLIVLAVGAVFAGIGGALLGMVDPGGAFWGDALFVLKGSEVLERAHHVPALIKYLPLVAGVIGISLGYLLYLWMPSFPGVLARVFKPVHTFLYNKWYVDELYNFVFVRPAKVIGIFLWRVGDAFIIDGFGPNGVSKLSLRFAGVVSRLQTGYVYHYAFVMLVGVVLLLGWYVW